jgi:hypothetical protein
MRAPQLAGFGVTVAAVIGLDLPVGWLVFIAMLCGGAATFAVAYALGLKR